MNASRKPVQLIVGMMILTSLALSSCSSAAPNDQIIVQTIQVEKEGSQGMSPPPLQPRLDTTDPSAVAPNLPGIAPLPPAEISVSPLPLATIGAASAPVQMPALTGTYNQSWIQSSPPPPDNSFQSYGVNPFEDPREDRLSTFALDVDTASYSVARRYVTDGNLPPPEAVRVEEFVNYFDAGYSSPSDIAFGLFADGAQSPFLHDGSYILRIGVQGYRVPDVERKPASLTFVIDISGSMDMENRLELVKQSLELLVDRLRPNDTVGIVVYGSDAYLVLNPTSGEDKDRILDAIYSLHTEGATNAEAGLHLGYQLAYQASRPGAINRVILLSDGVANVGATGPEQILELIRGYADAGITLTTVGFGMGNFNDVLMEQLADNGDGSYAYIDNLEEARKLFVEDLTSTLQVIAHDAKIQVEFNPQVVSRYRLIGYENRAVADQDFRNDAVDAGEIGAGHSATALYTIFLNGGAQGKVAAVHLRWQDPQTFAVHEISGDFNTWDFSPSFQNSLPRYQLAVVAAQYAELLKLSPWAAGTSIGTVLQNAVRISGLLPGDDEVSEFTALVSRASQIQVLQEWE